jgi:Protein O-mannosyl-transferase TMEM260-like
MNTTASAFIRSPRLSILLALVVVLVSLGCVFLSCWHLTRSKATFLLGTAAPAVSHTFWTYAVMSKVYSLNAPLLAARFYLLLRWRETGRDLYFCLFALLYG